MGEVKVYDEYDMIVASDDIKRKFYNESDNTILPIELLTKNITDNLNNYPGQEFLDLIQEASKFYNIGTNKIIPLNGSSEGIDLCIRTLCRPNDKIVIINPTFGMYESCATNFFVKTIKYNLSQESDFHFNTDDFISFCKKNKPQVVFLANPFAQIGSILETKELTKIIENLQDTNIVIDEAYIEFSNQSSMIELLDKYPTLTILRTLSKFFGLAGIRLGFLFTNKKDAFLKQRLPDNVNCMTIRIGINLFKNLSKQVLLDRFEKNINDKKKLMEFLQNMSQVSKIYTSATNFLFVKLNCPASEFADYMFQKYNTKIKTFDGELNNFVRFTI